MKDLVNWLNGIEISEKGYLKIISKWQTGNYTQIIYTPGKGIEILPKLKEDLRPLYIK